MSNIFTSDDQSIGDSPTASELPMRFQDLFPLGLTGLISLLSKELLRVFSSTTVQKHQLFVLTFFMVQHSHPYMTTGKTIALTRWTFVSKVMSLLFNIMSICQQIWKTHQRPQDWEKSVYIQIPKKGNVKECSHYQTIVLISHASKVMLKILQASIQQYVDHEIPDVQAGF